MVKKINFYLRHHVILLKLLVKAMMVNVYCNSQFGPGGGARHLHQVALKWSSARGLILERFLVKMGF